MPLVAVDKPNRRALIAVAAGRRGPAGQPGSSSAQMIAGATIGGHRGVWSDGQQVRYASHSDLATVERVVGVTEQAATTGGLVSVKRYGLLIETTWGWQPGPVFLGADGLLTQDPPDSGAVLQIGVALDAITLDVQIGTPLFLD